MAQSTIDAPCTLPAFEIAGDGEQRRSFTWKLDWGLWLVVATALALGAIAYLLFLEHPRQLWDRGPHDRNYHYLTGLNFGLAFQQWDIVHLLQTIDKQRTWGMLHGLLVGLIVAVTGPDFRLGVLPSLAGWVLAAILSFLVARRMVARGGNLAGFVAALFILTSPAHQSFATDIMLESLGACLSLWVLHRYLVAVQEPSKGAWCLFGVALSLLFFLKTNYWLLALLGVGVAEFLRRPGFYYFWIKEGLHAVSWKNWLRAQLRHPLNYALALLLGGVAWFFISGGGDFHILGRDVSFSSPHNLLHLAYVVLFIRVCVWWRRVGREWVQGMGAEFLPLVHWHAIPVAVYFLLPKRLGYFLWFLSPANADQSESMSLSTGLAYYYEWVVRDYHLGLWSFVLALGLAVVALITCRKLKPGSAAMVCFLLVALFMTANHPNRKGRFLHSWVAAGWVLAGAGLTQVVYGRLTASYPKARPWLAGAAVGALGCVALPHMLTSHQSQDGGGNLCQESNLLVTDCYLPHLKDARKTLIVSSSAIDHLCQWTYLERYRRLHAVDTDIKNFGHDLAQNRAVFEKWMAKNAYDSVVFIDIPPGSYFFEGAPRHPAYEQVLIFLKEQGAFSQARRWDFLEYGCAVHLWTRGGGARAAAD